MRTREWTRTFAVIVVVGFVIGLLNGCQGVPPGVKPPESSQQQPPKIEEPKPPEQPQQKPEAPKETLGQVGALTVTRIEVYPSNRIVTKDGTVAFNIYLSNPGTSEATEDVALTLDGERLGTQKAQVAPGATRHLHFQIRGFASAGTKTVVLGGQTVEITVIEPKASRDGVIPTDAKVVSAPEGLSEPGTPGGKLVFGSISGPKTLNPVVAQETSSTDVTGLMHAGLIETRWEDYSPAPGLAVAWEISDDKKEIILHLRRGVRWSDGTCCFSADDVLFTYNDLHLNPEVNSAGRDLLYVEGKPLEFVKIDDETVKVIMPKPFRPILNSLTFEILPKFKLADKVAKLNPGAQGYFEGLKKVIEDNRKDLQNVSAEKLAELDRKLSALGDAVSAQQADQVRASVNSIQETLQALQAAVPEEKAELIEALQRALDDAQKALEQAEAGKWAGVSPELFNNTWSLGTPASEFVGLGPYRFVRYDVDQQVILERNPYYWKVDPTGVQLPYLDQFIFLIVPDQNTLFLKFQSGEIDTFGPRPTDWPLLMEGVKDLQSDCRELPDKTICIDTTNNRKLLKDGPTFGETYLAFNQDVEKVAPEKPFYKALQAVFRHVQFRRAMAHAVDKESIIENIYNGLALPQWSPVSMPSPYYDKSESFTKYEYSLEKAAHLLDEIGLTDIDGDGVRNITDNFLKNFANPEDRPNDLTPFGPEKDRELEFTLVTNSGNQIREKIVSLLADDFAKIGVKANARSVDFNALVNQLTTSTFEAMVLGLTGGPEPNNGSNVWKTNGRLHFWRYSSKESPPAWEKRVDELFDLGATTFDEDEVQRIYKEFQKIVSENLPYIYLVNQQFLFASKANLGNNENFKPNFGTLFFADTLWWKDEQRRK
ncbi:putative ABC transporter-binding protein [bacterium HR07]|uniref:Transporter n=1 Tax=Acetithermum autotrophicum TaxID=1446466 RepID=H5SQE1_ACEAU|nr:transporter [Candidatus Acetothermum autotrophicum]GBC75906.1 putative ABC transporter-binding protein [bacterium HR07]